MAGVLDRLDAGAVRRWARDALDRLGSHRDEIDGLNVFPVPDGDTGTNLYLTVESALAAVERLPDADDDLPQVADALATGALHGARGSSGVILSQLLRGWADGLREHPDGGARAVRAALTRAADSAYAAVSRPAEGTMLSVARAAAEGAGRVGNLTDANLRDVLGGALTAARSALERTPGQLDALGRAGVVDAGGRGLLIVLESLAGTVSGRRSARASPDGSGEHASPGRHTHAAHHSRKALAAAEGGAASRAQAPFEVMYLLDAPEAPARTMGDRLGVLGESVVVVGDASRGDEATWKVHVHTADVGGVLAAGRAVGGLHQVRVARVHAHPEGSQPAPVRRRTAVVAVAAASAAAVLADAGAVVVVREGATPDPEDVLRAVRDTAADGVVVLPDGPDAEAAAGAGAPCATARAPLVTVLPACATVPALAALAVHDPAAALDDVAARMAAAAAATRHGAVRVAESATDTTAGPCRPGDALGVVDDEVVAVGPDAAAVARDVADRLLSGGAELLTLVAGSGAGAAEVVDALCDGVRDVRPDVEVEIVDGGPDDTLLLLGVE